MKRAALLMASVLFSLTAQAAEGIQESVVSFTPQDAQGANTLTLEFPDLLISDFLVGGTTYHELSLPGEGMLGQPGAPSLPSVQKMIEMPNTSDVSLRFVGGDFEIVEGLNVLPEQERLHNIAELPLEWLHDEQVYQTDAFFPVSIKDVSNPVLLRNHRLVKASFFPVQVNPVSGQVKVWSRMEFALSFPGENTINQKTFELADANSSLDRVIRSQILNPTVPDGSMRAWHDAGDLPGNYLVYANTSAMSNSYFVDLLDWKRQKGHLVVVKTQNDVSFSYSAIRSDIISEYNGDNPPAYVLLVGDVDGSYELPTHSSQYDHYYAMIEGGDILGDVAVGRLSVDNSTQLATVCNKIMTYEQGPYVTNDAWLEHVGLTVGYSVCGMSMKTLSRSIAAELVTRRGYTDIDSAYCAGSSHVVDWFNEGISFYNYRGWIGMEGLSTSEIIDLSQGPRTPMSTIFTCDTGDFDWGDDYTEAFLNAGSPSTPGGAVACAGFATSNTHTRYNNVFCGGFYGALLEHDVPEAGSCLLQGKYELYYTLPPSEQSNAANFAYWGNLMGDPGTPLWAGVPGALAAAVPAQVGLGASQLDLSFTSSSQPVEGLVVCAYMESAGLQQVALTDANGRVILPLDGLQAGTLYLTATHHRYGTFRRSITVRSNSYDVTLSAWSVAGNSSAQAGLANQAVSFTLQNTGTSTMDNINVTPVLDAAYGSVSAPSLSTIALSPGATQVFNGTLLSPLGTLDAASMLPLQFDVTSNQDDFTLLAPVSVAAPFVTLSSQSYPNGVLNPGDTDDMQLGVQNSGTLTGSNFTVTLTSLEPDYLTIHTASVNLGSLGIGTTEEPVFSMSIGNMVLPGAVLQAELTWVSHSGSISGSALLGVEVGSPGQNDPTADDGYGYFAFENTDTGYMQTPSYNWYAISTPEGGSGTELSINDNGDEQDDGVVVSLPFSFTYYGHAYSDMMVCSNGFVAFDDDGFGEWDFRNHSFPTSIGPDAMIAPMWDDHLTAGAAGVWTYYDAAQSAFVVSWYNVDANGSGGPNTFQLVLYDPSIHVTVTGDGPFKFQYADFNDTQSNSSDFPYCAAGFKDESSTRGLTLVNYHVYPNTMRTIADGRAIYVSTMMGEFVDDIAPVISIPTVTPVFAGDPVLVEALISDYSGVASATLYWRLDASAWAAISMSDAGSTWSATIPAQSSGTVDFYIHAVDASEFANEGESEVVSYSPTTLIFRDGFDGMSVFTHEMGGGSSDQWHLETARSYGGSHSWKFGGSASADYSSNAGGVLTSPVMELPAGASDMQLSFWSWVESEVSGFYPDSAYDGGYMEFKLDGGVWTETPLDYNASLRVGSSVTNWFGYPQALFSGAQTWTRYAVDIPEGSNTLEVRFLFASDGGVTHEGWYLDEMVLTGSVPVGTLDPVTDLVIHTSLGTASLVWTAIPGATSYNVYAMDEGYAEPVLLGTAYTPFFQDSSPGLTRFYLVRAAN
jgi:hypothetical protein